MNNPLPPALARQAALKRARLPPLGMLRAFEAVARHGSMRSAAEELNLSHTVVSRHVRNLEGWLGIRLVVAGPRGVSLTSEGMSYGAAVRRAFDAIADASAELRPMAERTVLRLWCAPGFAARWLAPRLSALQEQLPQIDLSLRATETEPDFSRYEADIALLYGHEPKGDVRSQLLARPRMVPVASPGWIAAHAPIRSVDDLACHPLIHEESRDQWRNWFEASGFAGEVKLRGPQLGSANMAVEAAMAGQGIALAPELIVRADLAAGRLVPVIDSTVHLEGYYIMAPRRRWNAAAVTRFRAWLEQALAQDAPA